MRRCYYRCDLLVLPPSRFVRGNGRGASVLVVGVLAAGVAGLPPRALAAWTVRAEVGAEHDSNPSRAETVPESESNPPIVPSPAARGLVGVEGASRVASQTLLSLSAKAAGRGYTVLDAREESLLILQGALGLSQQLGRSTRLVAASAYYEAFQEDGFGARDFRSLSPSLNLAQDVGRGRFTLGAGYRDFGFKPAPVLNFAGPTATLGYHRAWGPSMEEEPEDEDAPDWDLAAALTVERRAFNSSRCIEGDICPPMRFAGQRIDDFAGVSLDLNRTTSFLVGAGAAFQLNASNSFGDGLWRWLAHVETTFLLPWELSLSARGELVFTRYSDDVPLRRDLVTGLPVASIEDESRSTLRVELMRPIAERLDLSARWVGYSNDIGGGTAQYRRHTFLLQLGVTLDAR